MDDDVVVNEVVDELRGFIASKNLPLDAWRADIDDVALGSERAMEEGAKPVGFAPVVQTSTCSAMARASSTSMSR